MEFKNLKTLAHDQYLRSITHVLVSFSLFFCIIFFHSSSSSSSSSPSPRFSFLIHSIKFYLSAIPLHSLEKRWVFLICNGILVIIANTSSFVNFPSSSSSSSGVDDQNDPKIGPDYDQLQVAPAVQALLLENAEKDDENNPEETSEEEETGEKLEITMEEETGELQIQGDEIRIYITEDVDDHFEENYDDHFGENYDSEEEDDFDPITLEEEEEEEEEEEGMLLEKLSAEELNKKFEDFIRKMKEDLWIEVQQQQ